MALFDYRIEKSYVEGQGDSQGFQVDMPQKNRGRIRGKVFCKFFHQKMQKNAMRKEQTVASKNAHEKIVFSDLV